MSQDKNYDKTHVGNLSNFFCKGTFMLFVSKRPQFTCLEAVNISAVQLVICEQQKQRTNLHVENHLQSGQVGLRPQIKLKLVNL